MRRPSRVVVAILLAGLVAVVGLAARGSGDDDRYIVKAVYDDVAGLKKHYDVKVDGVPAGTVTDVALDGRDRAVLTMALDPGAAPIGAGARAYARPANLLGEKYVDLRLGDRSRPQPSGSEIPLSRTGTPVELDDVLNTLDAGTRARLRILIAESGTALAANGPEFNALLAAMPSSLDEARRVVADIASENTALRRAIGAADRVSASVARRRGALRDLVDDAGAALEAVAERRADLGATLDAAPPALAQLNGTLGDLGRTAHDLTPASRALRGVATPLRQVLDDLPIFSERARGTLREAEGLAAPLDRLATEATPDVQRLQGTVAKLSGFARDSAPVARSLDRGVLRDAFDLMHGWSNVVRRADGLGHIFRVRVKVDQETITSALSRYGPALLPTTGTAADRRRARAVASAARPAGRAATPSTGSASVPERPAAPLGGFIDGLARPLADALTPPRAPAGRAVGGQRGLLDYLFGQ